jgi:hypothetical protein
MQLGMMNAMLRGLPMQNMSTQQYQATPSYLTQGLGAVGTLAGAAKAFGQKEGGIVDMMGKGKKKGKGMNISPEAVATVGKMIGPILMSDINLKENISHVGMKNGFNIYEYNYKNDPSSRYRGVMAQEVAMSRPDAVAYKNGYLGVYYDMIGLTMEKIK